MTFLSEPSQFLSIRVGPNEKPIEVVAFLSQQRCQKMDASDVKTDVAKKQSGVDVKPGAMQIGGKKKRNSVVVQTNTTTNK